MLSRVNLHPKFCFLATSPNFADSLGPSLTRGGGGGGVASVLSHSCNPSIPCNHALMSGMIGDPSGMHGRISSNTAQNTRLKLRGGGGGGAMVGSDRLNVPAFDNVCHWSRLLAAAKYSCVPFLVGVLHCRCTSTKGSTRGSD